MTDEGRGPVEPGAHFYRSYQLDAHGNPIDKRNAWQTRSLLYVRLIPPGAADVAHYRVRIPKDARGPITFTARLQYRKFAHSYTQFAYAGQPLPGQDPGAVGKAFDDRRFSFGPANIPANVSGQIKDRIPNLPIITLATATSTLQVGDGSAPTVWQPVVDKSSRERWNDWGIGLLLQGDLKGAEYAFTQVTKAEPEYADGWLNVARALIQEGETEAAKPFIREALARNDSLGRIHYFKALTEKADGDYAAAIASLERVVQQYPRDRVVLNQLARVLFLDRRHKEALAVLDRVAAVDPEDLQMHYMAMLAARGLGDETRAAQAEKLFLRFKADESAQAITARPRLLKPEDNNERQPIHEHETVPLRPGARVEPAAAARKGGGGVKEAPLKRLIAGLALAGLALAAAPVSHQAVRPSGSQGLTFTDVTAATGIRFVHNSGRAGRKWLPETMGSGVAFFDADGDGWSDLLFINGRDWSAGSRRSASALYRNNKGAGFTDITAGSGLGVVTYGMGVAAGDYDNDGRMDVYVTSLDGDRLYRNEGGGKFRDVTKAAGIANASFGTSAAWVDYDKDGRLDLFVANYVQWTQQTDLRCTLDGATKSYCTPESYPGTSSEVVSQSGRRAVRGCEPQVRHWRSHEQVARDLDHRFRQRRLARSVRGQRYPAKQAVSQQPGRHVQRCRAAVRRGLQRGRDRARCDGCRRGRLRSIRTATSPRRQLLQPDARPVPQRRQRVVRG